MQDVIGNLEGFVAGNEVIVVEFDLGDTPFEIETIGLRPLVLHLEEVNCENGQTSPNSFRTYTLNPVY